MFIYSITHYFFFIFQYLKLSRFLKKKNAKKGLIFFKLFFLKKKKTIKTISNILYQLSFIIIYYLLSIFIYSFCFNFHSILFIIYLFIHKSVFVIFFIIVIMHERNEYYYIAWITIIN